MRIHNPTLIDTKAILKHHLEFKDADITIQFSEKVYDDKILRDINELCSKCNSKLEIRFFGHEKSQFDASIVRQIDNVKSLCLDYLDSVNNISELSKIYQLNTLSLRIDKPSDLGILNFENLKGLTKLSLEFSKDRPIDISPLMDYRHLSSLHIYGEPKNLNSIGSIKSLKVLDLWKIGKNCPLDFVNDLPQLENLSLTLGGRENLLPVNNVSIKRIYLNQVRGFNDFSNIERFTSLEQLILIDLAQLTSIDLSKQSNNFKELRIFNCKKIGKITGVNKLNSLERLTLKGINIDFDKLLEIQFPKSLKIFAFYTGNVRRDKEINNKLKLLGYYQSIVEFQKD